MFHTQAHKLSQCLNANFVKMHIYMCGRVRIELKLLLVLLLLMLVVLLLLLRRGAGRGRAGGRALRRHHHHNRLHGCCGRGRPVNSLRLVRRRRGCCDCCFRGLTGGLALRRIAGGLLVRLVMGRRVRLLLLLRAEFRRWRRVVLGRGQNDGRHGRWCGRHGRWCGRHGRRLLDDVQNGARRHIALPLFIDKKKAYQILN